MDWSGRVTRKTGSTATATNSSIRKPSNPISKTLPSLQSEETVMDDSKKRKHDETGNGEVSPLNPEQHLRLLLDPLRKDLLVDLLVKLGTQYPMVAEEIRGVASADPAHRKLFVRGLAWETTSETLFAAFRVYGEIEEGAVILDKTTGKSRGYGFITFRHMESTQKALLEPSKLIDGRSAVCSLACEGLSSAPASNDVALKKLYIGGLSPDISSEALLSFFDRHGDIEEGAVAYDKETNKSRGFGFVTYKTSEAAKKAIDDPNKTLGGRSITVKLADSQKGKVMQASLPTAVVMSAGPVGYVTYPQALAAYPAAYSNAAPSQYAPPMQVSYAQVGTRRDPIGYHVASPGGASQYPYYVTKP